MIKLLSIILISTAQIGASNPKIINGSPAEEGKFPFAAAIIIANDDSHRNLESSIVQSATEKYTRLNQMCGASILDDRHLLSSANCIIHVAPLIVQVYVGSVYLDGNGTYYNISDLTVHPLFDDFSLENDIGIITLQDPITFGDNVQPINLPINFTPNIGDNVTAIGWGSISYPQIEYPNELQELAQTVVECVYGLNSSFLCVGGDQGQGLCNRDHGNPLIYYVDNTSYVIGVFSSNFRCDNEYPVFYTRVSDYIPWIESQLTL